MYNCDICRNEYGTDDSLLIHSSVVLSCEEYLDYLVEYWIDSGMLDKKMIENQQPEWLRNMARESIEQDAGQSPWLTCPDCTSRFFAQCMDIEAREQAHAFINGEDVAGYDGKLALPSEQTMPVGDVLEQEFEEPDYDDGPALLDQVPETSVQARNDLTLKESINIVEEKAISDRLIEEEAASDEIVEELPPEEPVQEDVLEEIPVEEPEQEEILEEIPIEDPADEELIEEIPAEEPEQEETLEEIPIEEPVEEELIEEIPLDEPVLEETLEDIPVDEPEEESQPDEDDTTSAADILKSLEGGAPPVAEQEEEIDLSEPADSDLDDDLHDLGISSMDSDVVDETDEHLPGLPKVSEEDLEDLQIDSDEEQVDDLVVDEEPADDLVIEEESEELVLDEPEEEPEATPEPEPVPELLPVPPGHIGVMCSCGKQMNAPESYIGKRFRCKACGTTVVVGQEEELGAAQDVMLEAVNAVGEDDLNTAISKLGEALKTEPDSEEVADFAAMTLFQASQRPDDVDEELLKDSVFDSFFNECEGCNKTWVPNPIAGTGDVTQDGGVCTECAQAFCAQCATEGGEVCKSCQTSLEAPEAATGRNPVGPVDTKDLHIVFLLHEAKKFEQTDLNRILAEFRPELKVKGVKFALFPMHDWPADMGQVVAVLASKHAKGADLSRLRQEIFTDSESEKRLCFVYFFK